MPFPPRRSRRPARSSPDSMLSSMGCCRAIPFCLGRTLLNTVEALVAEHRPQGPTEEHFVEELAGVLWRKRRLRLAEAAAHRRGLHVALQAHSQTARAALVHLEGSASTEAAREAVRATQADTDEESRDLEADEDLTRRGIELLGSSRNDAYELALSVVRED